jgi:hypothetical protein
MIFVDWKSLIITCTPLFIAIAAIVGLRYADRISQRLLKVVAWVFCLPVFLLASLIFVLFLAGSGCRSYSTAIYSPSGKMAVRLETVDVGALGGDTAITLHWAHGLRDSMIVWGTWRAVEPSDIRWVSDSQLQIRYNGSLYGCKSAGGVKVECLPRQ